MRSDGFCLARLGHHEQLGQDGHRLQVDAQRPQNLHHAEVMVQNEGQKNAGRQQKFNPEGVVIVVVCGFELEVHQVASSDG